MRAKFSLDYNVSDNTGVLTEVISDIMHDKDKKDIIQAVADMLGIEVTIHKTYAEKVFEEGDEAHE